MTQVSNHALNTRSDKHKPLNADTTPQKSTLCRSICTHVAWALLVHSLILIFFVNSYMRNGSDSSIGSDLMMVIMVGIFVLIGRTFHHLWQARKIEDEEASARQRRYRLHIAAIWMLALGLPFFWIMLSQI